MIRLALVLVFLLASLNGMTQVQWVIQGGAYDGNLSCAPVTLRIYDSKGTPGTGDDVFLVSWNPPVSADWPPTVLRTLITLPSNFNDSNARFTVSSPCGAEMEHSLNQVGPYCIDFTRIGLFPVTGETWGSLYRFTTPIVDESQCDQVSIVMPDYCYNSIENFSPVTTWIVQDIHGHTSTTTTESFSAGGTVITAAYMIANFPDFDPTATYTMTAYDGSFQHAPVSFRIRSPKPQINFQTQDQICTTNGKISIAPTGNTIYTDIDQIELTYRKDSGIPQGPFIVPVASLANYVLVDGGSGSYEIQASNINFADPNDDCFNTFTKTVALNTYTLNLGSPSITPETCFGSTNNGSIALGTPSGQSPFVYSWSKDSGPQSFPNASSITGLDGDETYDVTVTDSYGCTGSISDIFVDEPNDINLDPPIVDSHVSCVGNTDGQITVTASGGAGTLKYSNGGGFVDGNNNPNGHIFSNLGAGNYTITVQDGNNCTKSSGAVPVVAPDPITATATPTSATCNGFPDGEIEMENPSGGTGNFMYSLNGSPFQSGTLFTGLIANTYSVTIRDENLCTTITGATVSQPLAIVMTPTPTLVTCADGSDGTVLIAASNTVGTPTYSFNGGAFQPSNLFTGLSASPIPYPITVKDGNGCLGNGNVTITSNPAITGDPIPIATPISCNGGSDGALNLTPGGGVGPYTFLWSNGATTEDISSLAAGTYSVTVKDTKNCEKIFTRVLTQPFPVTVNPVPSDFNGSGVSCFGNSNGSINITPAGGNGGYTYLWSNGSTAQDLSGLIAGAYTVTVTDNKGCTSNQSTTITQPTQFILSIDNTQNISCSGGNNGSITLSAAGGTTDYEFSVNNGSSWQSSGNFSGLTATTYNVVTRDENGCTDNDAVTLTSPTLLVLTVDNVTNTTCNQSNGSASASATGGVSSYAFTWFNSGNTQIGNINAINNLSAGVYRIEVTDQNSCIKQQNVTISSSNGPAITVATVTPASCSNTTDGSATISITQGQTPYTILWPNGQTTTTATNLAGGDYIVEVRDNTNCLALQTIIVPAPLPLTIQTITQQNPSCFGNSNGEIEVAAQGGNGTYTYSWNTGSTSSILTNLAAGTYTVTTNDIKNCQAVQQFTLTNPPLFTISLGPDEKICEGQTIVKESDVDNATYEWTGPNNFMSSQQQVSLSQPGTYTLTVTNQSGCEATDGFELSFDTDLLKADFLMVSQAYVGDTIIVIDISWPLPSSLTWQFDPAAVVLDESPDYSLIRFDDPGDYNVLMIAQLAQCASSHSQSISIIENPNGKTGGKKTLEGIIKELHVYPNPATDKLTVVIELNEEGQATIEIYHLQSNRRELSQLFEGNVHYETDVRIGHLQTGLYVIAVKAGNEMKSLKVIKL